MARRAFFQFKRSATGQQSVVALDIIALMDALKIDKATLAGFDCWGGTKSSTKRPHPTFVFARFHLRAQRLEVRFAIDHPFRSA